MKKCLGLFLLIFAFNASAGSKNAFLVLRAIVPEKTEVKIKMDKKGPRAEIHSNLKKHYHKFSISKRKHSYLVSITHP